MLDVKEIHSMSDFLTDHQAHLTRIKETRMPEVLTVDGRAEVVLLDTESYEDLMDQLNDIHSIAAIQRIMAEDTEDQSDALTSEELGRRSRVMDELTAETERLGLYR
jgi:PHD/YefM family antitoxin component YafN of YafNO toxin-antitoxin module